MTNFLPRYSHDAGLHLVLSLPDGCDDVAIASRALHKGVVVRALSQYYLTPQQERGLLLGYACVDEPTTFCSVYCATPVLMPGRGDCVIMRKAEPLLT